MTADLQLDKRTVCMSDLQDGNKENSDANVGTDAELASMDIV